MLSKEQNKRFTEVGVGGWIFGVEASRFTPLGDRAIEVAFAHQQISQVAMQRRRVWYQVYGCAIRGQSTSQVTPLLQRIAQVGLGRGVARVQADCRAQFGNRFDKLAFVA